MESTRNDNPLLLVSSSPLIVYFVFLVCFDNCVHALHAARSLGYCFSQLQFT